MPGSLSVSRSQATHISLEKYLRFYIELMKDDEDSVNLTANFAFLAIGSNLIENMYNFKDYKKKTRIFQRLILNLLSSLFVAETVSILKPLFLLLIPLVTPFQLSESVEEVFYKTKHLELWPD